LLKNRGVLLTQDRLHRLSESVMQHEFESLVGDVRIPAAQLFPLHALELFLGHHASEHLLQFDGGVVPCALLAATEFFVTFLESSHPHYFLTILVCSSRFVGVSLSSHARYARF
jgi:hypothetical protein